MQHFFDKNNANFESVEYCTQYLEIEKGRYHDRSWQEKDHSEKSRFEKL